MPASLAVRNDDLSLGLRSERFGKLFNAGLNSFIQEARLLARFNHPGLLHVLRFWEENGTAYMGTLWYSGMSLKAWQQQHPDTINEAGFVSCCRRCSAPSARFIRQATCIAISRSTIFRSGITSCRCCSISGQRARRSATSPMRRRLC